ncbi:hypothetical protein HQ544_04670 [Candidatus Falkowbacteria bacterium]|nr:hypothetical protein [Candidatus Falkowbacteria bacterium]
MNRESMAFLDKPKNNIIVIIIAGLIVIFVIYMGGRFTHEMYEQWKINSL